MPHPTRSQIAISRDAALPLRIQFLPATHRNRSSRLATPSPADLHLERVKFLWIGPISLFGLARERVREATTDCRVNEANDAGTVEHPGPLTGAHT